MPDLDLAQRAISGLFWLHGSWIFFLIIHGSMICAFKDFMIFRLADYQQFLYLVNLDTVLCPFKSHMHVPHKKAHVITWLRHHCLEHPFHNSQKIIALFDDIWNLTELLINLDQHSMHIILQINTLIAVWIDSSLA